MAKNQTVPVGNDNLKADADALAALTAISDYAPANSDFTLTKLNAASDALKEAADAFAQAEGRLADRARHERCRTMDVP
jgi:hypothetical protein